MLGTIKEEAAACRKAFEGVGIGAAVWLCNHDILITVLREPPENRITCILEQKAFGERALRLHEFRPVRGVLPSKLVDARAKLDDARAKLDDAEAKWYDARAKWVDAGAKLDDAEAKWVDAGAKWYDARAKWEKAEAKWYDARAKYMPELTALHLAECPDTTWR